MAVLEWTSNFLVKHPYLLISIIGALSVTCVILPFTVKSMEFPTFQDPQLGFSTRGTYIANRLTAWSNLMKSVRPYGPLIKNPKEYILIHNLSKNLTSNFGKRIKSKFHKSDNNFETIAGYNQSSDLSNTTLAPKATVAPPPGALLEEEDAPTKTKIHKTKKPYKKKTKEKQVVYGNKVYVQDEVGKGEVDFLVEKWKTLQNFTTWGSTADLNKIVSAEKHFCGSPDSQYAHFVVKSRKDEDLFTIDKILSLCRLQKSFVNLSHYTDLCIQNKKNFDACCMPWSLPNYVAVLNNKNNCMEITKEDVEITKALLTKCAPHYHSSVLTNLNDCIKNKRCDAPLECIRYDAVFNIMNFLTDIEFLPPNDTANDAVLLETMVFLPVACSMATLPYYHEVEKLSWKFEGLEVVAMEFGIKSSLFDEYLIRDTSLIFISACFLFGCIWIYTKSVFLTMMTLTSIFFTLAISYVLYMQVYQIEFFPFMNILTIIVILGIGADDAFIFCKMWDLYKHDERYNSTQKIMQETFRHAFIAMLVTALTTSVAFWGSYVSSVTAVACFSIFAGTAVVVNYILMITWFPAALVIWAESCATAPSCCQNNMTHCLQSAGCLKFQFNLTAGCVQKIKNMWRKKKQFLIDNIIRWRYLWVIFFLGLSAASAVVVFIYPQMQLPSSVEFQLFSTKHPFEQYDFVYKSKFWFKKEEKDSATEAYKLPLRFVWGVKPVDNGDYLNPLDMGSLVLDPDFDMAAPESQEWLLGFCEELRKQPFYESVMGPAIPNCFIETFAKSMNRRCTDPFTADDLTPCCNATKFPFSRSVFDQCIVEEMNEIHSGPDTFAYPQTAGPKFDTNLTHPTIRAVVVEYDSNFTFTLSFEDVSKFFNEVISWTSEQMANAPVSMKNGFFVSDLHFYDLQNELRRSTSIAIFVSMGLALTVLFLSTLNLLSSILCVLCITCSILVTIATLVLLDWKLNILESVAVSTAIGLTVDFSIHYAVNYKLCPVDIAVDRAAITRYALARMMGPSLMAALTTAAAGAFMMYSQILPYLQIGFFLVLVMSVSWVYSTFLLGALFAIIGPNKTQCQYSYSSLLCRMLRKNDSGEYRPHRGSAAATINPSDSHELDHLTFDPHNRPTDRCLRRSLSSGEGAVRFTNKPNLSEQSPSATSAITIISPEDLT